MPTKISSVTKNGRTYGMGAKYPGGDARLPDGRCVEDVRGHELSRILLEFNIEGVSAEQGKQETIAAYVAHLEKLRDMAATKSVDAWLEQHRPKRGAKEY
jgi:hypothetical protein